MQFSPLSIFRFRYGPHFETGNVTNITVQVGSTFYLHCRISLLQDKTVSELQLFFIYINGGRLDGGYEIFPREGDFLIFFKLNFVF